MKTINSIQIDKKLIIKISLLFIFIGIFTYVLVENKQINKQIINLNSGWKIYSNNRLDDEQPDNLLIQYVITNFNKGDTLDLVRTLDDFGIENPGIILNTWNSSVEIFIDDNKIYSWGSEYAKKGKELGGKRHQVNLPKDYIGKKLKVRFTAGENNAMRAFEPIAISSLSSEKNFWFDRPITIIFSGLLFLVMGIIIFILSYIILFDSDNFISATMLGMSFQVMGIYFLSRGKIIPLLIANEQIHNQIEFLSLFLLPLFLLIYSFNLESINRTESLKKMYQSSISIYISLLLIAIFLDNFTSIHYHSFLLLFYICSLVSYIIIYLSIKNSDVEDISITCTKLAILAFFCGSSLSIVVFLTKGIPAINKIFMLWRCYDAILMVSSYIVLISFFIAFYQNIAQSKMLKYENDKLHFLSNYDSMTTISNKRAFETALNDLDYKQKYKQYGIIVIDINNLKTVNDTLGHKVGDQMIESVGSALRHVDKKYSSAHSYRIGGDEFTIICYNIDQIYSIAETFKDFLREANMQYDTFNISISMGKATTNDEISSQRIFDLADKRMYMQKMRVKQLEKTRLAEQTKKGTIYNFQSKDA